MDDGLWKLAVAEARAAMDARPEQAFVIANADAIDLGIALGVAAAFVVLRQAGYLDD